MRASSRLTCSVAASLAAVAVPLGGYAKDLEILTRLLVPAYMAQNFAALCLDQDAKFLSDLNEGTRLVAEFVDHVKNEITSDLLEREAESVRIAAADAARNVARYEMQLLGGDNSGVPAEPLKRWCDRSAKHFIVEIINKHREKHEEFEKLMAAAKR